MAVDTKEKRLSMLNVGLPWWTTLPEADGAIDADDRLHLLGLYSGIAAVMVTGPFYPVVAQVYTPGSVAAEVYAPGSVAAQVHSPGSVAAEESP